MHGLAKGSTPELPFILDLELEELEGLLAEWGEPRYRAAQIWQGLYHHLWSEPQQFTNLPLNLRQKLADRLYFSRLQPVSQLKSNDEQTDKTLFRLPGGNPIEAVLMKYDRRRTLCISSQSGCAMGCRFCATGQLGLLGNLSSGEIVDQVLYFARQLQSEGEKVSNVVLMGMGEPFNNYQATLAAINRLNHPQGFNLGSRRFTISTVGLAPFIRRFAREGHQVNLAVSLHAADDELRSALMPINRRYPLEDLRNACLEYVRKTHRRISFEWALIDGVNDSLDQAEKLCSWLAPFRSGSSTLCHVNLIRLYPTRQYSGDPAKRAQAMNVRDYLTAHGFPCTIRLRRGIDIQAGCGQLAAQKQ